ncbi:low molecular weight protein tyrosine phosphatase [Nonlabens marinus S1-08]|uniref:protein-tyrosine-phosphatase n=2 Tax=Nonlabens TaxID=363408 RepID=W8VQS2_9FLAO|nr:low molecular weight protein tyrosine phosphatase [Nonlabens marinus S1-08]
MRSKLNFTKFVVDSAGTSGGHKGEAPDKRSIEVAEKNGLDICSQQSRKLLPEDLEKFDYIYVMDQSNLEDVQAMATSDEQRQKIKKILDVPFPGENLDVPDPYYGGSQGFINVYKMLDQATDAIKEQLH